jgi:hypothetical protein
MTALAIPALIVAITGCIMSVASVYAQRRENRESAMSQDQQGRVSGGGDGGSAGGSAPDSQAGGHHGDHGGSGHDAGGGGCDSGGEPAGRGH